MAFLSKMVMFNIYVWLPDGILYAMPCLLSTSHDNGRSRVSRSIGHVRKCHFRKRNSPMWDTYFPPGFTVAVLEVLVLYLAHIAVFRNHRIRMAHSIRKGTLFWAGQVVGVQMRMGAQINSKIWKKCNLGIPTNSPITRRPSFAEVTFTHQVIANFLPLPRGRSQEIHNNRPDRSVGDLWPFCMSVQCPALGGVNKSDVIPGQRIWWVKGACWVWGMSDSQTPTDPNWLKWTDLDRYSVKLHVPRGSFQIPRDNHQEKYVPKGK